MEEQLSMFARRGWKRKGSFPGGDDVDRKVFCDDGVGVAFSASATLPSSITVSSSDGNMAKFRVKREMEFPQIRNVFESSNLLSVSFDELKSKVREKRYQSVIRRAADFRDKIRHSGILGRGSGGGQESVDGEQPNKDEMWVKKHVAKQFTHLLSDDGVNRILLSWLKLWDGAVFGLSEASKKFSIEHADLQPRFPSKPNDKSVNFPQNVDASRRPKQKVSFVLADFVCLALRQVALLCGPPGLGKTTLAHVLCDHAGYSPIEINASDDRSPEMMKSVLENVTKTRSLSWANEKPSCLIIDEIDGALPATINMLVSIIKGKSGGKKKSSKGKQSSEQRLVSRPIIAICNDSYSLCLKPLKPFALILSVPPLATARLASRLQQISVKERMSVTTSTLISLCDKTSNDIRSCLNVLQFLHQADHPVEMEVIESMCIGQKDMKKSLFSFWQDVFILSRKKQQPVRMADGREHAQSQFDSVILGMRSCGDHDKAIQGLYENYLKAKVLDRSSDSFSLALEWLLFADQIHCSISHHQTYEMLPYFPYVGGIFFLLFASAAFPRVTYPSSFYEHSVQKEKIRKTANSLTCDFPVGVNQSTSVSSVITSVAPRLLQILSPTFRPVDVKLFGQSEKEQLKATINIMVTHGINYCQQRSLEGQYAYEFEPNIELITKFSESGQHQLSYATRQLISHEIEREKMRKSEANYGINPLKTSETSKSRSFIEKKGTGQLPSQVKAKTRNPVFFQVQSSKGIQSVKKKMSVPQYSLWFRFTEGFSNAVKRTVKVQDFL
eukprot:m.38475 g.38475  ORF g.38475 m.38475 type:complete len:784 (+) comp32597_c0_seq3:132-2483(+)